MYGYAFPRKISGGLLGTADMSDGNDAPNVKIIPPLVYLAGIVIGFLATIWMPTKSRSEFGSLDGWRNSHSLRRCSDEALPY